MEVDPADEIGPKIPVPKLSPDNSKTSSSPEVIPGKELRSPMPGILLRYLVEEGQKVGLGEPIAVLEAMKMENALPSPANGTVLSLPIDPGNTIAKDEVIARIV